MDKSADRQYQEILKEIWLHGHELETRNYSCFSNTTALKAVFNKVPLVTFRKTAWKKALLEYEWFLSGCNKCPEQLSDWWKGQLNEEGRYLKGYGDQLTDYTAYSEYGRRVGFNQIEWLIKSLKEHPNSRRLITTTWNPEEMRRITDINDNINTPTCCHHSFNQYFIRDNYLHITTYARSQDILLGTPHNWVQTWAYLMWLSYRTGYKVGTLTWIFGDAHVYNEESHLNVLDIILNSNVRLSNIEMFYTPTSDGFKASDFTISGEIPVPVTKIRPKLL